MKKVFVTGASGMLGMNTVLQLQEQGYLVRAMVRASNCVLRDSGCEVVEGDVMDYEVVRDAMRGCDSVVHIAATTVQSYLKIEDYLPVNVDMAVNVCRAAQECGNLNVVVVCTANTIGNGTAEKPSDESYPPSKPFCDNLYAKSKIIAQERTLATGANVCHVYPTFIIGQYDHKPTSGKMLQLYYGKRFAFEPKGGKSFVAARDVVRVIGYALENGRRGDKFLAAGENLSFKEFLGLIYPQMRVVCPPSWLLLSFGAIGSLLRACGVRTPLSYTNMKILCTREYYRSSRVEQFTTHSIAEAAQESLSWMLDNGVIKDKKKKDAKFCK